MPAIQPPYQADNGVSSMGLIKFRSVNALEAERQAKLDSRTQSEEQVTSMLSGYVNKCRMAAQMAKQPIERQMIASIRQRNGIYDPEKLADIRAMGGSEVYVMLTATKCRAAGAWISDVIWPTGGELPFSVDPTPIAELTPDLENQIIEEAKAVMAEVMQQVIAAGEVVSVPHLKEEIREYAESRRDEMVEEVQEEAKVRAKRMELKIADQLAQGNWRKEFEGAIDDMITLKAGIIKGPVVRRRKTQRWVQGTQGWTVDTPEQLVLDYERISPLDIYPEPDSRGVDDGYLLERQKYSRTELVEMIGVPGYSEPNIRAVLRDYGQSGGKHEMLPIDAERAIIEHGSTQSLYNSTKIEAWEFWGSVQGSMLIEWGMSGKDIDPDLEYEICALVIGSYVVRAIRNPDKLGRKPYSVDSFERVPGSFWGKGIPDLMSDIQDVCNAVARAIVNNASFASGPLVEVNKERVKRDGDDIHPWKIFQSTNANMSESPAVRFYQPQIVIAPLLQAFEFFAALSEDQTGIPRWAYGQTNIGGAGDTSSGLSMLMTNASRGVKQTISHADAMTEGVVSRTYDYNMLYDPDDSIKGDCRCVSRGSTSNLAKEQRIQRGNETLAATTNPLDSQILGMKGRAKLLREQFKLLDIDPEGILPDDSELEDMLKKMAEQNQPLQIANGGVSPVGGSQPGDGAAPQAAPQTLDNAGNPAGGTDANLFQNQAAA